MRVSAEKIPLRPSLDDIVMLFHVGLPPHPAVSDVANSGSRSHISGRRQLDILLRQHSNRLQVSMCLLGVDGDHSAPPTPSRWAVCWWLGAQAPLPSRSVTLSTKPTPTTQIELADPDTSAPRAAGRRRSASRTTTPARRTAPRRPDNTQAPGTSIPVDVCVSRPSARLAASARY